MAALQRLGRSLMLPLTCLIVSAILMGVGYWIDPDGMGENNLLALILIKAGIAPIENMGFLFAAGVSFGMADDNDGTAALAGLVSMLIVLALLSVDAVAMFHGISPGNVNPAFEKINGGNQFVGILCGLIGAYSYNRFKSLSLPDMLRFYSGKRSVTIIAALFSLVLALLLYFIWPVVYTGLVSFGEAIQGLGAAGAGIYGFFNRLLIPFGLHHALNSVFWFDIAGISDIARFWGRADGGEFGRAGMYMTGFFPIMMFGVPGGALAIYHSSYEKNRKAVAGLMLSAAFASFFTGITEPFEFCFLFLAPPLFLLHALLTSVSLAVCTLIPVRSGFNFSAGLIDWLLSFNAPMAQSPLFIIPIGLVFFVIYYILFRLAITRFNLRTPGREDDEAYRREVTIKTSTDYPAMALAFLDGLGGKENISMVDSCITRLRVEVVRPEPVNERKLKAGGAVGIVRPSKTNVQIVTGTNAQFVANELNKLITQTRE